MKEHRPGTHPKQSMHRTWAQRRLTSTEMARSLSSSTHLPAAKTTHQQKLRPPPLPSPPRPAREKNAANHHCRILPTHMLLYRQPDPPATNAGAQLPHPQIFHSKIRAHLTEAKRRAGDQKSNHRPPSSPQQPDRDHQTSPDRKIREDAPAVARRHRLQPRQEGDRTPAPLFPTSSTSLSLTVAPPGTPTLLCTRRKHRGEVPHPSRRRSSERRGEEPPPWPATGTRTKNTSLSPLRTVARG